MYGHNAKRQSSGNVSSPQGSGHLGRDFGSHARRNQPGSPLAGSAHRGRSLQDKNKPPEREPSNLDPNAEKPTPQIPALKEMRIWMLGGIREVRQG
jgi:hypothetical protein